MANLVNGLQSGQENGYIDAEWQSENHKVYFQAIPDVEGVKYWLLTCVNKSTIIAGLDMIRFQIPLFVAGIVMVFVLFYMVYVRTESVAIKRAVREAGVEPWLNFT